MNSKASNSDENTGDALLAALLPLARILIRNGLGAEELVHAAKMAYVQAAMNEVAYTGGKVNVSRLSVVTGLTRKEIPVLLGKRKRKFSTASHGHPRGQRAFRVVQGWSIDPLFLNDDGRPADLEIRSGTQSFTALVRRYGGDVTPVAVLRELERMQAITHLRTGKLRLRPRSVNSRIPSGHQIQEFARLLSDFATTAQQISLPREPPLFFGFRDSQVLSPHQAALFQRAFSQRAAALLASTEQWAARQSEIPRAKEPKSRRSRESIRVGVGVYLLQDPVSNKTKIPQRR